MKRVLQTLATLAVLAAIAGAAIVFGGLFNVSARAGHWAITPWLLHTTFRNSVELRAPAQSEVPDLSRDGMVALGAGHFDEGCRTCHAAPGHRQSAVAAAMVPRPPHVSEIDPSWKLNELHWIVDEGVKMSGMPHWPAPRTDDVWPVVAFLVEVRDMTGAEYDDLTARPEVPDDAPDGLAYCAMCHGLDGRSGNQWIPRLDIQPQAYLERTLLAYADGARSSGIMHMAASRFPEADLVELAAWFAGRESVTDPATRNLDAAVVAEGANLASRGTRDVPACTSCHGPKAGPRAEDFPRLAGQSQLYLAQQLRLWRDGDRGGAGRANLMAKSAQDLSDADIAALAAYFASLSATRTAGAADG